MQRGFQDLYVNPYGIVTPCGGADHGRIVGDPTRSPVDERFTAPRGCPATTCQCDTENINTVLFEDHYRWLGANQHRFVYRFAHGAKQQPELDEWVVPY